MWDVPLWVWALIGLAVCVYAFALVKAIQQFRKDDARESALLDQSARRRQNLSTSCDAVALRELRTADRGLEHQPVTLSGKAAKGFAKDAVIGRDQVAAAERRRWTHDSVVRHKGES